MRTAQAFGWKDSLWAALALLPGACAYLTNAPRIIWAGEDVPSVFGLEMTPLLPLQDALRLGGFGSLSIHRALMCPFVGYGGWLLGPCWAHVLQVSLHLATGLLLYFLLRRLRWTAVSAAWATAFFVAVPWGEEAVQAWYCSATVVCTLLVMLAAHAYVSWSLSDRGRWLWLAGCMAALFSSLMFYELWLAGFIFFWTCEVYLLRTAKGQARTPWLRTLLQACRASWPVLLPYLLYALLFLVSHRSEFHQPIVRMARVPVVFLSAHLRIVQWLTHTPWALYFTDLAAWVPRQPYLALAAVVAAVSLLWMFVVIERGSACGTRLKQRVSPASIPLVESLVLAWGCLAGSRLVFILQNGVSLQTRHSYGATMGVAIAFAAIASWATSRLAGRAWLSVAFRCSMALGLLLLVCASLGSSVVWRDRTIRADIVYRTLAQMLERPDAPRNIVIVNNSRYALDDTGGWMFELRLNHHPYYLEYPAKAAQLLAARRNPVRCYVVGALRETPEGLRISVSRTEMPMAIPREVPVQELVLPFSQTTVLRWDETTWQLVPLNRAG